MSREPRHQAACAAALAIASALFAPAASAQADWSEIRRSAEAAVVFIECILENDDGTNREIFTSSGFTVSPSGHILTVAHAVPRPRPKGKATYRASLKSRHEHKYPVAVVTRDDGLDLALLLLPNIRAWPHLRIGDSAQIDTDTRLYALGFPGQSDLASADGLLSSKFSDSGRWQTTIPLNPGHSGGPVFDQSGMVIAMAAAGAEYAQGKTFIIPSHYMAGLRQIIPIPRAEPPYRLNTDAAANGADASRIDLSTCPEITFADYSEIPVVYRKVRQCK